MAPPTSLHPDGDSGWVPHQERETEGEGVEGLVRDPVKEEPKVLGIDGKIRSCP